MPTIRHVNSWGGQMTRVSAGVTLFGTPTFSTTGKRNDDPCHLVVDTGVATTGEGIYVGGWTTSGDRQSLGFWFRAPSLPASGSFRCGSIDCGYGTGVAFLTLDSAGTLKANIDATAAGSGYSYTANTWVWIEMIYEYADSGTHTLAWRVDQVGQTGVSVGDPGGHVSHSDTGSYRFASLSTDASGYTFHISSVVAGTPTSTTDWFSDKYMTRCLRPNAVGTHNLDAATSTWFFDDASAALTTSETTSYQKLDETPADGGSDFIKIEKAASYCDPNGNGTNTAWTGDYTSIDDAVRDPTNAETGGDGNSLQSGTATALEDTNFGTTTYVSGATYTLHIFSKSGAKRGLSVSINGGSSFTTVHGASASAAWRTVDATAQITDQTTLDAFSARWRCDSTAGGGGAGVVDIYAAYLSIVPAPTNTWYAEYAFEDSAVSTAPVAAQVVGVMRLVSGSGTNSITVKASEGGSETTEYTGSIADTTQQGYRGTSAMTTKPSGGAWTDSALDGLTARWGYTADANPAPRLDALWIDALFVDAGAGSTYEKAGKGVEAN